MERSQLRFVADADVYTQRALATTLHRDEGGTTTFVYDDDYVERGGAPVALSLRIGDTPVVTPSGGLPPFCRAFTRGIPTVSAHQGCQDKSG